MSWNNPEDLLIKWKHFVFHHYYIISGVWFDEPPSLIRKTNVANDGTVNRISWLPKCVCYIYSMNDQPISSR